MSGSPLVPGSPMSSSPLQALSVRPRNSVISLSQDHLRIPPHFLELPQTSLTSGFSFLVSILMNFILFFFYQGQPLTSDLTVLQFSSSPLCSVTGCSNQSTFIVSKNCFISLLISLVVFCICVRKLNSNMTHFMLCRFCWIGLG